jgi:hypothetical protein
MYNHSQPTREIAIREYPIFGYVKQIDKSALRAAD